MRPPGRRARTVALLIGGALLCVARLGAQDVATPLPTPTSGIRVGLALSGGSAKGFAHIGVLEVLEAAGVPIDLVAGTSSGALVGGLYAVGYSPAALRRVAETEDWEAIFTGSTPRDERAPLTKLGSSRYLVSVPVRGGRVDLPEAFVGSQHLATTLSRLIWSADTVTALRDLPIPFVAVASDLETGTAVPLTAGPLSVAIRASVSLPGLFTPASLGGRRLIDGGVARNLPASDARDLGADLVICVDVSGPLERSDSLSSVFDIMMQVISFQMATSNDAQRAICDVLISPALTGLSSASFEDPRAWIKRGREAAEAAMPTIQALLDARGVARRAPPEARRSAVAPLDTRRRLPITRLAVHGDAAAAQLASSLGVGLENTQGVGPADAAFISTRLHASGRYEVVAARPEVTPDGLVLRVDATPTNRDRLGLGLRYDSQYKAALLLGLELHGTLGAESSTSLDLRLGEQLLVDLQHRPAVGAPARLIRSVGLKYLRTPLDFYTDGAAVARADVHVLTAAMFAGVVLPRSSVSGVQLAWETFSSRAAIAPVSTPGVAQGYLSLSALSWTETFDRAAYPTRGIQLFLQSELADRRAIGNASFVRNVADLEIRSPLREGTTMISHLVLGEAHGPDLPVFDRFFLGGATPNVVLPGRTHAFAALRPEERGGTSVQLAELGVQQEIRPSTFLTLRGSLGNTFDAWPGLSLAGDHIFAGSATLGVLTPVGPASLTLGGRRLNRWPLMSVAFGFQF